MKRMAMVLMIAISLAGCGQELQPDSVNIDLTGNRIVWQGPADTDPAFLSEFYDAMDCLREYYRGRLHDGCPYLIRTEQRITDGALSVMACTDRQGGIIYLQYRAPFSERLMFRHEVIHWATGLGIEAHDGPLFMMCSPDDPH